MTLTHILILSGLIVAFGLIQRAQWRSWFLLTVSMLAVYWLQPATPIYHLDFWLPTATLILAILGWAATVKWPLPDWKPDLVTAAVFCGIVSIVGLTRYLGLNFFVIPSRPPDYLQIAVVLLATLLLSAAIIRLIAGRRYLLLVFIFLIIGLFVILKTNSLALNASTSLYRLMGQASDRASALDLRWLGFSFVAYRLLHTFIDRLNGRRAEYSLREYLIYIIFFPAFTAGPLDRIQRFTTDLRRPFVLSSESLYDGGSRIVLGIFKKFALADALAVIALNEVNASQVHSTLWLWGLLYAYALRIYFDFSGYTDIAVGMGRLLGFRLPENFERPYLKPNLTLFWNSWHITLAQWFRAYFFNPVTRNMRGRWRKMPLWIVVLTGQLGTMLLIGLWHGVSWNFAFWGLWHALGLFIHNRWGEIAPLKYRKFVEESRWKGVVKVISVFLTFNYVALGWVWFCLPSIDLSWSVFLKLFGV